VSFKFGGVDKHFVLFCFVCLVLFCLYCFVLFVHKIFSFVHKIFSFLLLCC
jgi:hypothetical protein